MRRSTGAWLALGLTAVAAAAPAAAYILPTSAVLRRVAAKREELALTSLEARGTLTLSGETARRIAAAISFPLAGPDLELPAAIALKLPGRCRLELAPPELAPEERPALVQKGGKTSGRNGLDGAAELSSLLQGVCTLLGQKAPGADGDRPYAEALGRLGVALPEVRLARFSGRLAYAIGARDLQKPQAWVDKGTFQPVRLSGAGATPYDVRLVDWGSPTGGDWFPRAVELAEPRDEGAVLARFTTEKVQANPKLPDALF